MGDDTEKYLASGTIPFIVGQGATVSLSYEEHESRNGRLLVDLSTVGGLDCRQLRELAEQLEVQETKLREGRRRYARLAVEAAIWEEDAS